MKRVLRTAKFLTVTTTTNNNNNEPDCNYSH